MYTIFRVSYLVQDIHLKSCTFYVIIRIMEKEAFKFMPLKYKIDVLQALKEKGYTTYKLRHEKLLSESTLQKLRTNKGIAWDNIETLCGLLDCNVGDLLEYVPSEGEESPQ